MPGIDEPVEVIDYDPRWPAWFEEDAAELHRALGARLKCVEHFGSTAVDGMAGKPIIDILVAPVIWPLDADDREALRGLGYEHLGEAGVPGREYLRRRRAHATNLAVAWNGALFRDNLLLRDYLRAHAEARAAYSQAKRRAIARGSDRLITYSTDKAPEVALLLEAAQRWRTPP